MTLHCQTEIHDISVIIIQDDVFYCFLFFQSIGEFLLTDRDMKIKPRGKIYSINEGYSKFWDDPVKEYIESVKYPKVKFCYLNLQFADFEITYIFTYIYCIFRILFLKV